MLADIIIHLRTLEVFEGLDDEILKVIARVCRRRRFAPRTTLFHQDDPGQTLYMIASGSVSIQTQTSNGEVVHIAQRVAGEQFGELSLLDGKPRSADAVTGTQPTDLIMLDREAFLNVLQERPVIARNVIQSLASRLRATTSQTTAHQRLDVSGRLASFLLEMIGTDGTDKPDDASNGTAAGTQRLSLGMTQQEIGNRIGASRETVTRTLARMEQLHILERKDGQILVRNLNRLRQMCSR